MVGIAGVDFCLIAADTRLAATEQYFIRSRNTSRVFEVLSCYHLTFSIYCLFVLVLLVHKFKLD